MLVYSAWEGEVFEILKLDNTWTVKLIYKIHANIPGFKMIRRIILLTTKLL